MLTWENFEVECLNYLIKQYGDIASFELEGGYDSTKSDIKVTGKNGIQFYIEIKHSPAQSGQFVLIPNVKTKTFEYSSQNATQPNEYVKRIIKHMNDSFEDYKEAGTKGKDIWFDGCNSVFANWIKSAYRTKRVRYIVSNNYIIVPLEQFEKFFNISAKYRVKRSGSSSVGSAYISSVCSKLKETFPDIESFSAEGNKLYLFSREELHNKRIILGGYEYMISKRDDYYEVRKLSNTFNANVIFSIDLKPDVTNDTTLII